MGEGEQATPRNIYIYILWCCLENNFYFLFH